MLLYIHIPFCRAKCEYCAFHSLPLPRERADSIIKAFTGSLFTETRLWSQQLSDRKVSSIFFGGGTPSLLAVNHVAEILEEIAKNFQLLPGAEVSLEANPESALAPGWLAGVKDAGVTRLSLGVQSFDPVLLTTLGRRHTADEARQAVTEALTTGFESVNLDLMWGLPGQTLENWLSQLDAACSLGVDHISAYGLTLEPECPLTEKLLNGFLELPKEDIQAEMFLQTAPRLATCGISQYEISNYAKPGHECRHNLGYWAGRNYLGLGPAATSCIHDRRWTNPEDMRSWQLTAEEKLFVKVEELTPAIKARELLMLSLRTVKGLSPMRWMELTGTPLPPDVISKCKAMRAAKLLEMDEEHIALTPRGMLLSNLVIEQLFTSLPD